MWSKQSLFHAILLFGVIIQNVCVLGADEEMIELLNNEMSLSLNWTIEPPCWTFWIYTTFLRFNNAIKYILAAHVILRAPIPLRGYFLLVSTTVETTTPAATYTYNTGNTVS